jgi:endonuclease YncB( thermonuclease family)
MKISRMCALLLALFFAVPATAGVSNPRKVVKITDGDTIHVEGIAERLRLIGVDAPEVHHKGGVITSTEPCGREAWQFLATELAGQEVRLEQHGFDKWGRRLVYAWRASDRWFVNVGMVASGYATVLRDSKIPGPASRRARMEAAESAAKLIRTPVLCAPVPGSVP